MRQRARRPACDAAPQVGLIHGSGRAAALSAAGGVDDSGLLAIAARTFPRPARICSIAGGVSSPALAASSCRVCTCTAIASRSQRRMTERWSRRLQRLMNAVSAVRVSQTAPIPTARAEIA